MADEELDALEAEAKATLRDILVAIYADCGSDVDEARVSVAEAIANLRDQHKVHWTDRDGTRRVSDV